MKAAYGRQFARPLLAEIQFAVCTCPSVDRCERDRFVLQPCNIREASRVPPRLDPHHGIDDGVESFRAPEDLQSDAVAR